ncbi:MAG TPA: hypothetical protein VK629_18640 [Steroidobacteraceae bacterium]|nr:hypothetical protein [Steroidobacteraceae bacterium]
MKFNCPCGGIIVDQTDYLSFKGHLVADRDWEDFANSSESRERIDSTYVRVCYQCPKCGRLHLENTDGDLRSFVPEGHQAKVLNSIKGRKWRGPLVGRWNDSPPAGQPKGTLWCDAGDGVAEEFKEWSELERVYRAQFESLRKANLLRSALLRKNEADIHVWASE